jgi:hypothetical protein
LFENSGDAAHGLRVKVARRFFNPGEPMPDIARRNAGNGHFGSALAKTCSAVIVRLNIDWKGKAAARCGVRLNVMPGLSVY